MEQKKAEKRRDSEDVSVGSGDDLVQHATEGHAVKRACVKRVCPIQPQTHIVSIAPLRHACLLLAPSPPSFDFSQDLS